MAGGGGSGGGGLVTAVSAQHLPRPRAGCREGSGQSVPPRAPLPVGPCSPGTATDHRSRRELREERGRAGLRGADERGRQVFAAMADEAVVRGGLASPSHQDAATADCGTAVTAATSPTASSWNSPMEVTVHAHEASASRDRLLGRMKHASSVCLTFRQPDRGLGSRGRSS